MRLTVDADLLEPDAVAWWKAQTPDQRGVVMQVVYELETSGLTPLPPDGCAGPVRGDGRRLGAAAGEP